MHAGFKFKVRTSAPSNKKPQKPNHDGAFPDGGAVGGFGGKAAASRLRHARLYYLNCADRAETSKASVKGKEFLEWLKDHSPSVFVMHLERAEGGRQVSARSE